MENLLEHIECPECGCKEIHIEYDDQQRGQFPRLHRSDDTNQEEVRWCYCLRCGVMFDPAKALFLFG